MGPYIEQEEAYRSYCSHCIIIMMSELFDHYALLLLQDCWLCPGGASAGVGPYVEVVFLHKQSKTLIVTDAVVCVPPSPPQVVRTSNLLEAGSPLPGEDSSSAVEHTHLLSTLRC